MQANKFLPDTHIPIDRQNELTLLTLLVWGEARGESPEGKSAVAWVVINRWRAQQKQFGLTLHDVILKPQQFSCFNPDDPNAERMKWLDADPSWFICFETAAGAYCKLTADPTGGATHYCRFDCKPAWLKEMVETRRIGNHIFYKEKISHE